MNEQKCHYTTIIGAGPAGQAAAAYLLETGRKRDHESVNKMDLQLPESGCCTTVFISSMCLKEKCCGGPAKSDEDACCMEDEQAKETGATGCGCGSEEETTTASCC